MSARGPGWWLSVVAAIAMTLVVATGLWVLGTPSHQRALRLDARRVQNLRMLTSYINVYWQRNKMLPENLEQLPGGERVRQDPVTKVAYEYAVTGKTSYQLCATFQLATPDRNESGGRSLYLYMPDAERWRHTAGKYCFDRSVKP